MEPPPATNSASFTARAVLVGERIDVRAMRDIERLATMPLAISLGEGVAVLFRYGAVVFFDVSPADQDAFFQQLQSLVTGPYEEPETEEIEVRIDPEGREAAETDRVVLHDRTIERFQLVAEVLGTSVLLALFESQVARDFERIEPFAANLEQTSRGGRYARDLLSHLGATLLSEHKMVGRAKIGEKPDLLWERPDLERLFLRLEDEYEIRERHQALLRKFELISRTAQTGLGLLEARRTLRVEWYIVILIAVEIVLLLYDIFTRA